MARKIPRRYRPARHVELCSIPWCPKPAIGRTINDKAPQPYCAEHSD